ncbi:hypothetical protein QVD17_31774 [Tagetes erecta]|uniref:PB1 domain-containing protein n=1 Tax=Tagetes erecta TaxID=13708 RepID=A0AAD8K6V4_TARER|nr:hypothetical protein QVD17_31774 [Tagetes erecta]
MKTVVEQVQKALDNQLTPSGSGLDDNDFGAHLHGIFSDINIDSSWLSLATINHDLSTIPSSPASGLQNSSFGGSMQESSELLQPNRFRTYTKVYKSGCVGRSIDLSQINSYHELRAKMAKSFGITGLLEDPQSSGWQLVFFNKNKDIFLLGDDPWEPFVRNVSYIKILSPEEVQQFGKDEVQSLG